jgi:hypothetical protein
MSRTVDVPVPSSLVATTGTDVGAGTAGWDCGWTAMGSETGRADAKTGNVRNAATTAMVVMRVRVDMLRSCA